MTFKKCFRKATCIGVSPCTDLIFTDAPFAVKILRILSGSEIKKLRLKNVCVTRMANHFVVRNVKYSNNIKKILCPNNNRINLVSYIALDVVKVW